MVFLSRSDGKVLIQHRGNSKETFPGLYDSSSAFHVTYGETYEAAAARELKEETGVSSPLAFLGRFEHHDAPEHEIVAVFVSASDGRIRIDPSESSGFEFLTVKEIDKIISTQKVTPWLRDGWKLARQRLRSKTS
jgi:isopentenyldiphosphate isomerase